MHLYSAIKIKTSVIKTVVYVHIDHKGHQQKQAKKTKLKHIELR